MRKPTLLVALGVVTLGFIGGCGSDEDTGSGDRALNGDPPGGPTAPAPPPSPGSPGPGPAAGPVVPGFSAQIGNAVGGGSTTDKDGNVIVVGQARTGGADFGKGKELPASAGAASDYLFLAKYDAKGALVWHELFTSTQKNYYGSLETQVGAGVPVVDASGNIILAGSFGATLNLGGATLKDTSGYMDVFVAKFAPDGKHLWSKSFEGPGVGNEGGAGASGAATDAQGNVIVTGTTGVAIDFGGGKLTNTGLDAFVVKLAPDGKHVFSKLFDSKDPGGIAAPAVDSQGNIGLTGAVRGTVDFGGGPLPNEADPNPAGGEDLHGNVFLVKLGPTGNHVFSRRYSANNFQGGGGVAFDNAGNVIFSGGFRGALPLESGTLQSDDWGDMFVAKVDPTGKPIWGKRFGLANVTETGSGVAVDASGRIVVAGDYNRKTDFGLGPLPHTTNPDDGDQTDVFVLRLDDSGTPIANMGTGDGQRQNTLSTSVDKYGRAVVSGSYAGVLDFGFGPMPAKHVVGVFFAAVNP